MKRFAPPLVLLALVLACSEGEPLDLQGQIEARAAQALEAAGIPEDVVRFEGPDARIEGPESARPMLERASEIVGGIPGVRSAEVVTTGASPAEPELGSVAAAPLSEPEPEPPAASHSAEPTLTLGQRADALLADRRFGFETGGTRLDAQSRSTLAELASLLAAHPEARIRVEGHTDSRGDDRANLSLSEARAQSVASELARLGVDAGRIQAVGYGESRPLAGNDTEADRRRNRRVEIRVGADR